MYCWHCNFTFFLSVLFHSYSIRIRIIIMSSCFPGLSRSLTEKWRIWRVEMIQTPTKCWMRKSNQWWAFDLSRARRSMLLLNFFFVSLCMSNVFWVSLSLLCRSKSWIHMLLLKSSKLIIFLEVSILWHQEVVPWTKNELCSYC